MLDFLVFVVFVLGSIVVIYFSYRRIIAETKGFKQFASEIGFSTDQGKPPTKGGLFAAAVNSIYRNVLRGNIGDNEVSFFQWDTSFGSQKFSSAYEFVVAKTAFNEILPDFFLCPTSLDGLAPYYTQGIRNVKLEGNFSEHFRLYIDEKEGIDNLTLFTPNFMERLIQDGKDTILFSSRGSLYWLRKSPFVSPASNELRPLYTLLVSALPLLNHTLENDTFSKPQWIVSESTSTSGKSRNLQAYFLYAVIPIAWLFAVIYSFNYIF